MTKSNVYQIKEYVLIEIIKNHKNLQLNIDDKVNEYLITFENNNEKIENLHLKGIDINSFNITLIGCLSSVNIELQKFFFIDCNNIIKPYNENEKDYIVLKLSKK